MVCMWLVREQESEREEGRSQPRPEERKVQIVRVEHGQVMLG